MARGNQLDRQWRLLQLIDRPAGVTVEDAARDLGCHDVHTIWRDVDVLARPGLPIYDDKAGDGHRTIWRVTEEFRRRLPLKLGPAEVLALLMSRDLALDPAPARPARRPPRADPAGRRHPGGAALPPGLGRAPADRDARGAEAGGAGDGGKLGRRGPGLARVEVTNTRQTGDPQRAAAL
jgi:hypothetical protein